MNPNEGLLLATVENGGPLKGLDPHHIHKLGGLALEARFEPGQVIFHEGDEKSRLYIICGGTVVLKSEVDENSVQTLRAGDVLGWSALLEDEHRHFEALCVSPVQALAFEGAEVLRVFEADPRLGYAVMKRLLKVLAQRIEAARHSASAPAHGHCKNRCASTVRLHA